MTLLIGWAAGLIAGLSAAALAAFIWWLARQAPGEMVPDFVPDYLVEIVARG